MKVLITGATGFVGKNLLKKISDIHEVVGVGSKECDLRLQQDTRKLIKDIRPDVVIHAAGSVGGIGANRDNPGKFMYENLVMGTNMIHESLESNVSKFILLGTVCAYPKFTQVPFKEEDIWLGYPEETNAPYGIAKKTLSKLLEAYNEQYGMNVANLIPVNMYGPEDHFNLTSSHVIPALILKLISAKNRGESSITVWGTGQASREFLYVDDCVDAIIKAVGTDVSPEPINIGTGKEIKICDLVQTIADCIGFEGDIVYDTTKPDGQPRRCLDTTRAKERLGFEAKTSLKDGVQKTIDWYLSK